MKAPARGALPFLLVSLALLLGLPQSHLTARPQEAAGGGVSIFLSARDAQGNPVTDLRAEEIRVVDNWTPLRVESLQKADKVQLTVGLMIDTSGSRRFQLPGAEREGAQNFVRTLARMQANAFVECFNEVVHLHADVTSDLGEMQAGLKQALAEAPRGGSSLYSSILAASRRLLARQDGRKILVVTSDGVDNSSPRVDRDVKHLAKKLMQDGTILYAIVLSDSNDQTSSEARRSGFKNMKMMAERSGGSATLVENEEQVTAAFAKIAANIASQYQVDFIPHKLPKPGELRSIRAETTRKHVVLFAPEGYFAPDEPER